MTDQYSHDASASKRRTKSWRDVLPTHPAADMFPLMKDTDPEALRALGEDIKKHGLKVPIAMAAFPPNYPVLDGRNRLDAMELVGLKVPTTRDGKLNPKKIRTVCVATDPYAYVASVNIHRRHLTAEQKRDLIEKLLQATPEKSDRQIAETIKADHKTVAAVRAEKEARGEIPHVATRTDTKGRNQQARKPAKFKSEPTESQLKKHRLTEIDRTVARSEAASTQAVGNAVDSEASAEQRKAEAAADVGEAVPAESTPTPAATCGYTALVDAWERATAEDRKQFLAHIGAELVGIPDFLDRRKWPDAAPVGGRRS